MMQDVMTDKIPSVENALKDIAQPTEERTPPPPPATETKAEIEKPIEEIKPEKPSYATDDFIESATDVAFAILDNTQETIFTIAANYKKKKRAILIGGENGVAKLIELKAAKTANAEQKVEQVYTGTDAKLLSLDATVDEFIKGLAFTDKQIKMMRPGLKLMVEKNAGKIPPELLFYAGLITAIGGNLAEYYTF